MKLQLQVNSKFMEANTTFKLGSGIAMVTPPLDDEYWLFRVPVSKAQAIVGFPKFGTIGIGFQHEEDWNTNLPYQVDTESIYKHIRHNKGDRSITKAKCLEAIKLIQQQARMVMETKNN